jgi:hypothetical protein
MSRPLHRRIVTRSIQRNRHRLQLGIVVEGLFSEFPADSGPLEASEGGGGVEDVGRLKAQTAQTEGDILIPPAQTEGDILIPPGSLGDMVNIGALLSSSR